MAAVAGMEGGKGARFVRWFIPNSRVCLVYLRGIIGVRLGFFYFHLEWRWMRRDIYQIYKLLQFFAISAKVEWVWRGVLA